MRRERPRQNESRSPLASSSRREQGRDIIGAKNRRRPSGQSLGLPTICSFAKRGARPILRFGNRHRNLRLRCVLKRRAKPRQHHKRGFYDFGPISGSTPPPRLRKRNSVASLGTGGGGPSTSESPLQAWPYRAAVPFRGATIRRLLMS